MGFFGSLLRTCKKACKNAVASVVEKMVAPVVQHVAKKIVRRINEVSRAITPVAYGVLTFPVQGVVAPAGRAIIIPVIVVASPVVRRGSAIVDKVHSWLFRRVVKPLYKGAVLPMLRHLRASLIDKVIVPAIRDVTNALDRALIKPIAQGAVQPVTRDIYGHVAQNIMARVARDFGHSVGPSKTSSEQEMGDPVVEEVFDPTPKSLDATLAPPPAKKVHFTTLFMKEPSGQDLVKLVLGKFGIRAESRMSHVFMDFILSSGVGEEPVSFSALCDRCQRHCFHSGSRPSDTIPPHHPTVDELLRSIQGGCRLCLLIHETLSLPTDGSLPDKSGLGFISRLRVSSEKNEGYLSFMSHVPRDDSIVDLMKAYLSPNTDKTDSPISLDFARTWHRTCKESHDHCSNRMVRDPIKNASLKIKAPFRLVDIIDEKIEEIPDETREYVALSYTWGDMSKEGKKPQKPTLKENIEQRKYTQGLASVLGSETLPAVYKDTIQIAKRLGYRYVWVDVWCNVQDDNVDLEAQITNMGYIFQNADLTIGAGAGRANTSSLFSNQQASTQPFLINTTIDGEKRPVIVSRQLDEVPSILDTRLWVFQEQLLSRRTVEFGLTYTTWRCSHETAVSLPISMTQLVDNGDALEINSSTRKLRAWIREASALSNDTRPKFDHEFAAAWYSAARNYTKRSWSVREDQIPALVGVTSVIARQTGWQHLGGLWREDMPHGLAWYRNREPAREDVLSNKEHEPDCAPSWSWAARANGPVSFWARDDVQRSLVKFVRSSWDWPSKKEAQRRLVLAGEVSEASICQVRDDDWDWIQKTDGYTIAPIEIEGVRVGYGMFDAPMVPSGISILPLFTLRPDGEHGAWGLGLALTQIAKGGSCWYQREGLVVLLSKVGTDYDYNEFDEDDDEHKIILA
ncbi:putative HET domain-containing protein [Triangularia setosa]|uniref:HET domain-containing protein n=1 Tax=Triangularia setosa TaxID=2587417 RepID=A0AAN6WB17_9PEZI|nr:putative HET domain-containing protein [Podospora setosa]